MSTQANTPRALTDTFSERAEVANRKFLERVSKLPEADRRDFASLVDRQNQTLTELKQRQASERPVLYAESYQRALAGAPKLTYEMPGTRISFSAYQDRASQRAQNEVARTQQRQISRQESQAQLDRIKFVQSAEAKAQRDALKRPSHQFNTLVVSNDNQRKHGRGR